MLTNLQALDLNTNQLKDLDDVIDVLRSLPKLRTLFISSNPMFPTNDQENRIKFLSKLLQFYDPLTLPLKHLDSQKISILEKV